MPVPANTVKSDSSRRLYLRGESERHIKKYWVTANNCQAAGPRMLLPVMRR